MTLIISQGLIFFFLTIVSLVSSWPVSHQAFHNHSYTISGTFHPMHLYLRGFLFVLFCTCISRPIGNSQGPGRWGCSSPGFFHSVLSEALVSRQKTNLKSHVNPLLWLWLASVYSHIWEYFYLPQSCAEFSVWFCPNVWVCVQISPFVYIGKWCLLVRVFLCTYRYAHYSPFMMLGFRYFVFFTRGLTDHLNLCSVLLLSVYENTGHCGIWNMTPPWKAFWLLFLFCECVCVCVCKNLFLSFAKWFPDYTKLRKHQFRDRFLVNAILAWHLLPA